LRAPEITDTVAILWNVQVKVYDLANFSMKFERHLDSEIVDFQVSIEAMSSMTAQFLA